MIRPFSKTGYDTLIHNILKTLTLDPSFKERMDTIEKATYFQVYGASNAKWKKGVWKCMHPDCTAQAIGSHTIQRANNLEVIAEEGIQPSSSIVVGPEFDPRVGDKIGTNISQYSASVFPGFCAEHDRTIFWHLDHHEGTLDENALLLQCSRTFCREYRAQHHQFDCGRSAFEKTTGAQHEYVCKQIEAISGLPVDQVPGYRSDRRFQYKARYYDRIRAQATAQDRFIKAFEPTWRSVQTYLGDRLSPNISVHSWSFSSPLDFAISGVDDIGLPGNPVPMFYFAMPEKDATHLAVFCDRLFAPWMHEVLKAKQVNGLQPGDDGTSLFRFFEQLLIDRTNHWFLRRSVWLSLPDPVKSLLTEDVQIYDRALLDARPPVLPVPKELRIRTTSFWAG